MKLLKNGAIVDEQGRIVVRLVYGGKRLNEYVLRALEAAPADLVARDLAVRSDGM